MTPEGNLSVTEWRLSELERNVREMRGEVKAGIANLDTKLEGAGKLFLTRVEYEQRHSDLSERMRRIEEAVSTDATRFWLMVSALGTLLAASIAAFGWLHPAIH